jgi:hypothetical protein
MTLNYRVVPLTDPASLSGKTTASDFTATWTETLDLLERELKLLHASNLVFELDVLPGQLTQGGNLKARSRASSGAVRIGFETPEHGTLTYGTAAFTRGLAKRWRNGQMVTVMEHDWQHNVRAIALGLEALRKVDRYGIGQGAQYAGYKALGAGSGGAVTGGMTQSDARGGLISIVGEHRDTADLDDRTLYRWARAYAHPDVVGHRDLWDEVEQAGRVLGLSR